MTQALDSGLNINLGDECSKTAFNWACHSFSHRKGLPGEVATGFKGSYSNMICFGKERLAISSDGIGTKVELAERTGIYNTIAFDLMAMVVDDLICNGAEPTNISNILDVDKLDHDIVDQLMSGLYEAAKVANVAVTGGEIAELGNRIGGYGERMHFNWCATGMGIFREGQEPITGGCVEEGDVILAVQSQGFRSNGFSLARKVLNEAYGDNWHEKLTHSGMTWGESLLTPSLIVTPGATSLFNSPVDVRGVVHVTGGGIAGNLKRMLKINRLGAVLDNLFPPHSMMLELQEMGNISEAQVYELWNMGNAFLFILKPGAEEEALGILKQKGLNAQRAGRVVSDSKMTLYSLGRQPSVLDYSVES